MADIAFGSPERYARINVVEMLVRVIATLIDAAIHSVHSCTGIAGNKKEMPFPKAQP